MLTILLVLDFDRRHYKVQDLAARVHLFILESTSEALQYLGWARQGPLSCMTRGHLTTLLASK